MCSFASINSPVFNPGFVKSDALVVVAGLTCVTSIFGIWYFFSSCYLASRRSRATMRMFLSRIPHNAVSATPSFSLSPVWKFFVLVFLISRCSTATMSVCPLVRHFLNCFTPLTSAPPPRAWSPGLFLPKAAYVKQPAVPTASTPLVQLAVLCSPGMVSE